MLFNFTFVYIPLYEMVWTTNQGKPSLRDIADIAIFTKYTYLYLHLHLYLFSVSSCVSLLFNYLIICK